MPYDDSSADEHQCCPHAGVGAHAGAEVCCVCEAEMCADCLHEAHGGEPCGRHACSCGSLPEPAVDARAELFEEVLAGLLDRDFPHPEADLRLEANKLIDAFRKEVLHKAAERIRAKSHDLYGTPDANDPTRLAGDYYGLLDAADLIDPDRDGA